MIKYIVLPLTSIATATVKVIDKSSKVITSSMDSKLLRKPSIKASCSTIQSFVIQKYIEKPLLYKGYKFDIRVFGLFTQKRELYIFQ